MTRVLEADALASILGFNETDKPITIASAFDREWDEMMESVRFCPVRGGYRIDQAATLNAPTKKNTKKAKQKAQRAARKIERKSRA